MNPKSDKAKSTTYIKKMKKTQNREGEEGKQRKTGTDSEFPSNQYKRLSNVHTSETPLHVIF